MKESQVVRSERRERAGGEPEKVDRARSREGGEEGVVLQRLWGAMGRRLEG